MSGRFWNLSYSLSPVDIEIQAINKGKHRGKDQILNNSVTLVLPRVKSVFASFVINFLLPTSTMLSVVWQISELSERMMARHWSIFLASGRGSRDIARETSARFGILF